MEGEPREVSGLTTSLILSFVEREGGPEAVERALRVAGMEGEEEALRDEDRWFADRRRVELFKAASEVLGDPDVARRIGSAAIDFNIGQALKVALRNLGSPRLIYSNIVRANAKLNKAHQMSMIEVGEGRAALRNAPIDPDAYDPVDCQYNEGILSCVPRIFGYQPARVRHPVCIGEGADECVFEVSWHEEPRPLRWVIAGFAALAIGFTIPSLLWISIAAATAMALIAGNRVVKARRAHANALEGRIAEQTEAAERMMSSLKNLASELRLDEVLEKIIDNAKAAVGGAEFALLVREGDRLRCRSSSDMPDGHLNALERWAEEAELPIDGSLTIDDLRTAGALERLAEDSRHPVGAICVAPLSSRGERLGSLIALSGIKGFLPRDAVQLESYAAQAAIALTNARLYEAQQELAIEDPLTGLHNHRHFHEVVEHELGRCRRYGTELGVATFDLDGFKLINDREGHAEGDRVLRRVADALRDAARESDAAFRVGGDEFALVLPMTGGESAVMAARRVAAAIDGLDERIAVSWGVASWPDAGLTKDALLTVADQAMYEMKRSRWEQVGRPELRMTEANPIADSRKAERLVCTSRLAMRLAPMLDPEAIATTAVEELLRSFPFNVALVFRIDGDRLRVAAAGGPLLDQQPPIASWEQSVGEGICGRAARIGEPVLVADTRSDPGYVGTGSDRDSRSELAVPIRVGGDSWGVLNLEHRHTDGFEREDLLFAETVAAACGAAIHRSQLYGELESAFTKTLAVLSDALEAKDAYTAAHAREVSELAEQVAQRLGMKAESLRHVSYAALLHDIGKIGIRGEILRKPGQLSDAEYEEMKEHTVLGARMLERIPFFAAVHPMVRSSHERWDGRGYPDRLAGEEIPLGARIIGACDAFNAMTSDRPYRRAMSVAEARAELAANAGSQFDPAVAEILLEITAGDAEPDVAAAAAQITRAAAAGS